MPDHDVTTGHDPVSEPESSEMIREEPTEVTVEVVRADDAADTDEPAQARGIVIRHVLERQLGAGQSLSAQLVGASTEASVALANAPAHVIDEIRSGATLPAALASTRSDVGGMLASTGGRVRTAIGEYVGGQATLPNAVVVGAADVAEAVLLAQGAVAATALDAAFTVATVAARGGDLMASLSSEGRDLAATARAARADIAQSWERAAEEIRGALEDDDEYLETFSDED